MDAAEVEAAEAQKEAMLAHVVPFAAWIVVMMMFDAGGWSYGLRMVLAVAGLAWFRPWRWYKPPRISTWPLGVLVGVLVFVVWVLPESPWAVSWGPFREGYLRLGHMPPWSMPEPISGSPYAPETGGWVLTIVRVLGATVVVALIEEFFWRGFVYRWLIERDFVNVDLGKLDVAMLLAASLVFGLEHDRWLVGALAGLAYGYLVVRTRDLWSAVIAHAVTNFLLACYVLATGSYSFW
jgi:hypothetical protein